MSEMMSEAEMPATFSDLRGQTKESATKAKKHQPYNDDVADLAHPLFPRLLGAPFIGIICCEKSLSGPSSLILVLRK